MQREIDAWLWSYIEENAITAKHEWAREQRNALEAASLQRPRGTVALPVTKQMVSRIQALLTPASD